MRFPAAAIAICFTSGIAMGPWPMAANRASSRGSYFGELPAAFLLIAAAIFLLSREHLRAATFLSLAAWLVLGFFAASIAQQPKAKNYVLNVLNSCELDLHAPLRWHGILRNEPATLPWGTSYEIGLASVACQERSVSIQGALRASYTSHDEQLAAPELHAEDQVAIVTQARKLDTTPASIPPLRISLPRCIHALRLFPPGRESLRTSQSAAPRTPAAGWCSKTAHRHQRRDSHSD